MEYANKVKAIVDQFEMGAITEAEMVYAIYQATTERLTALDSKCSRDGCEKTRLPGQHFCSLECEQA